MSRNDVPVVITRKHKKIHKLANLVAFAATGGASAVYTVPKALSNASYNAETRKLAGNAPKSRRAKSDADFRADHVPGSAEYKAKHG